MPVIHVAVTVKNDPSGQERTFVQLMEWDDGPDFTVEAMLEQQNANPEIMSVRQITIEEAVKLDPELNPETGEWDLLTQPSKESPTRGLVDKEQ